MLSKGKILILTLSTPALFYALISPVVLPDVTICIESALIISFFVIFNVCVVSLIDTLEKTVLQKKIVMQHSQMKAIIDNIPFCMYLKKIDGTIMMTNYYSDIKKFANLISPLAGTNACDLYKNYNECIEEDAEIIKNKICISKERYIETINGPLGWCRVIKAPVFDEEGDVANIVVIFQNIDDEKEMEDRKSTFIATLTHDLKTPTLAQINALNILLKNKGHNLNQSQEELLKLIKNSCKYMYDLIFTISDTYLYDNGQTKINYEKFDFIELLNETINEISNLLSEKHQQININSTIISHYIIADRFQLKRVILNLISNAITYGVKDSIVNIIIEDYNSNVNLSVVNKAYYMPDGKLINMFEKFKTSSNTRFLKTSSGLGLYLSKQIITAHKGNVFASGNTADLLCTFGFSIPKEPAVLYKNI